jgi:peptide/nickel transport system substrate-binding protein
MGTLIILLAVTSALALSIFNKRCCHIMRGWVVCGLVTLTACQYAEPTQENAIIGFGLAQAPRMLDPRLATDASSERLNRLLYARLVEFNAASQPIPSLATWHQLTPTRYRFCLGTTDRDFTHGHYLTSADVVATYQSILDPKTASPHRSVLTIIDDIQIIDDDCFDFILTHADALFPAYLGIGILPADRLAEHWNFSRQPIGSGSFLLADWSRSERLVLQRRRDNQRIAFIYTPDPSVRVLKLLRGEIDIVQNDLPPELVHYLRNQPHIQVLTRPGSNFSYLGFACDDPITGQLAVRQAIAHAIDRQAILNYVWQGLGQPAQSLLPPSHWAGAEHLSDHRYDPVYARTLLASLGVDEQHPLQLTYTTSSDPFRVRLATIFQAQLAEVFIQLQIKSYDWGTFFGAIKAGRFQIYSLTWVGLRTPDIFRHAFHSQAMPPQGANRGRYHNPIVDRLIDHARSTSDLTQQAELYHALQAILWYELPYVPLWYEAQVSAVRARVQGYALAADGRYDSLNKVTIIQDGY